MKLRLGTRGSTLALTQSNGVADALRREGHEVEVVTISTRGDRERGSLLAIAGLGVFAAELRRALLAGECDLAVHSLKDLPVAPVEGLCIAAVPEREDWADALCARDGLTLDDLPPGARVGTGSPRRVAQLRRLRPDLDLVEIRGNVDTRLARVAPGDLDAVVLASAGLRRLGLEDRVTESLVRLLPAPGQGALGVECREDDADVRSALAVLDDAQARDAVTAERALLRALGGGCAAPIGAIAHAPGQGGVVLEAGAFAVDGSDERRTRMHGLDPEELGEQVAAELLAQGAAQITDLGATRPSRLTDFHPPVAPKVMEHTAAADTEGQLLRHGPSISDTPAGKRAGEAAETGLWPARREQPTVLIPREPGAFGPALEARGIRVLSAPVQHEVALDHPPFPEADWLVVTSARTVPHLEGGPWESVRVAAVGETTAQALEAAGFTVDLVPEGPSSGQALVNAFPDGPGRVVVPGSALSSPTVADGLRDKGWEVTTVPVYTMQAVDQLPGALTLAWQGGEVDAVLITSGSVARALDRLVEWPDTVRVMALGAPSAEALASLGIAASVAPSTHPEEVADAIRDILQKGQA